MEHQPWDGRLLRDCLQYMLNRAQIAKAGFGGAGRDADGARAGEWRRDGAVAGQAGARHGLLRHRVPAHFERSRKPPTRSAPAAIRGSRATPHLSSPAGIRGDGPTTAARYWGLTQQEYYQKADVWPLNPQGEIFCILQIEDTRGVENLDDILKNVPGIGAILIGEGDLSQELGYPRQYEHKVVLEWMKRVVDTCKKHNVVVGHPHVEQGNAERIVKEGYRFLMCAPVQSYGHLEAARKHTGRGVSRIVVIASDAKQSSKRRLLDCFVAARLAMTKAITPRPARPSPR